MREEHRNENDGPAEQKQRATDCGHTESPESGGEDGKNEKGRRRGSSQIPTTTPRSLALYDNVLGRDHGLHSAGEQKVKKGGEEKEQMRRNGLLAPLCPSGQRQISVSFHSCWRKERDRHGADEGRNVGEVVLLASSSSAVSSPLLRLILQI